MLSVKKNPSFGAYFDELKKLIQNGNCKKYSEKEFLSSFEDEKEENKNSYKNSEKIIYIKYYYLEKKYGQDIKIAPIFYLYMSQIYNNLIISKYLFFLFN